MTAFGREPVWLLRTKETKGPETDPGQPSVDEKPIPVFGISFGYTSSSDKGHSHRNFGQVAAGEVMDSEVVGEVEQVAGRLARTGEEERWKGE
jgi:hypothetical protein